MKFPYKCVLVEYHFGKNKSERFLGMIDIHKAKEIYLKEVEESGLLSKDELKKMYDDYSVFKTKSNIIERYHNLITF